MLKTKKNTTHNAILRFASLVCLAGWLCTGTALPPAAAAGLNEPPQAPLAEPIYVDADASSGNNDGTSWENAYLSLQDALFSAQETDEIWVAEGIYTPAQPPGNRNVSFVLKDGVKVYGGFAGGETSRSQRNPAERPTVLSGDLEGNDSGSSNRSDNSLHVVTSNGVSSSCVLDGFTIQGGNADGSGADAQGGGMRNTNGDPVLFRITFIGNTAKDFGGAVYNENSNPRIYSSSFLGNSAQNGGAIYNTNSAPRILSTVFSANHASANGGGIYNTNTSNLNLINTTFSGNSAGSGGGIYNLGSSPSVKNTILWSNPGGQVQNLSGTFSLQQSLIQDGCPAAVQCIGDILTMNPRFGDPDGLDNLAGTLDDNLRLQFLSPAIDAGDNSLILPDVDDIDQDGNTGEPVPYDRDLRSRFVEIAFVPDTGLGLPPIVDLGAYEARVLYVKKVTSGADNGTSWLNAYRTLSKALASAVTGDELWVAQGVYTPTLPGASPIISDTFQIRQGLALYGGFAGHEVSRSQQNPVQYRTVLSGDLAGNDNGFENNIENSLNVVRMIGVDETTVLNGFTIQGGNARYSPFLSASYRMVDLDAWMLAPEYAPLENPEYWSVGGGLYLKESRPLLANLTFYRNYAVLNGGGTFVRAGAPYFLNCAWIGNQVLQGGGGMYNVFTSPTVVNALFDGNQAEGLGGAMYNLSSSPTVINTTFAQNQADLRNTSAPDGDAIHNTQPSAHPVFKNTIFWDNDDEPFRFDSGSTATLDTSLSEFGCPVGAVCLNLINADPLFSNPLGLDGLPGTLDDLFGLSYTSPAIDAGNNNYVPLDQWDINHNGNRSERLPYDLLLGLRLRGAYLPFTVDLGALETQPRGVYLPLVVKP